MRFTNALIYDTESRRFKPGTLCVKNGRIVPGDSGELVDLGVEMGYIEKSGSWFSVGDERIGQGRDSVKQYLKDHPEFTDELENNIRTRLLESRSRTKGAAASSGKPAKAAAGGVDVSADDFDDEA